MKIYFASDHEGFELKHELLNFVRGELNFAVEDCGDFTNDPGDDYPPLIAAAVEALRRDIEKGARSFAIILGASGQGEAIVANRFPHIRAAVFYGGSPEILKLSREHNDANVLSLGALFLAADEAKKAVRLWLTTSFSGEERHVRRIAQIEEVSEK
ncbi:MAG TPA: RpiB/LacA/LacB family sugar-phosphate isomerase [Candidatus Paceibacterota bacterium]|nr:RpiB/LacA/LacB family sugar-phosphate isomerase [Candidatus Paceibacterota bacterium]